ncbi:MAG TPA: hypothetical protein IAA30_03625 [Candidatus Treponema faecavium]|nr:hypothetical protein [Candidatus Treponema faecavium]
MRAGKPVFWAAAAAYLAMAGIVCAASASVQIIQNEQGTAVIRDATYVFEDAVMNFCFEQGMIISNTPAVLAQDNVSAINAQAMSSAQSGRLEYYISVVLNYDTSDSTNPDAVRLSNIDSVSWQVYRLADASLCGDGTLAASAIAADDTEDGFTDFARQVAYYICADLNGR